MATTKTTATQPDALSLLDIGCCRINSGNSIVFWNDALVAFGVPREDALEKSYQNSFARLFQSRADFNTFEELLTSARSGETVSKDFHLNFISAPTSRFSMVLQPGQNQEVEILFRARGQAAEIQQRYETIFDNTPDGIMVMDGSRRVVMVNKACGQLFGRDPREFIESNCVCGQMVNCHLADGTSLASQQLCPARSIFTGVDNFQTETMLTTNTSGQDRWIETTYSPIKNEHGHVEYVIGIMRDIHERRDLEERLRQSEKLASLGQLTAGVAHEIKNPLGIILSSVEIILDSNRPKEMQREAAQFIREEVKRLDDRIRAFLKFARPSNPHKEQLDLNEIIQRMIEGFEGSKQIKNTQLRLQKDLPAINFDEDHLTQILTNLYINTFEAAGSDVMVEVLTSFERNRVILEINDNGPGIPEDIKTKIFDPFFTTDAKGTGLGLSIVYQLVTSNGGAISVHPSPLGGAMFRIEIPTAAH